MKNITYWGDMLNAVNAYVAANYGTPATAYKGPNGDGTLDGRIVRDGNDAGGSIVPVTILHHNDSHGNLVKGTYVGYTQLATLIKQERLHNPTRTLLLNGGDSIQGDAMSYYFKSAPLGYAADGTPLAVDLQEQPLIAAFNAMGYDAMTLGNHEFNFGSAIFKAVMGQATFPVLGANVADSGAYGLADVGVEPYVEKTLGAEGIKVAILGITNHRVPNYELPSNIPGLTFSDPLAKAQELSTALRGSNDALVALTHIGFTENAASVEVDKNVDTNMAKTVTGLDAIVGSHSHTDPSKQTAASGDYKYLPTIVAGPDGSRVVINQAYRYNNTLGEVVLGMRAKAGGGYEVVSNTGRYLTVTTSTAEDADDQGDRRPVRGGPRDLQQHRPRRDDGPDRHARGLHRGDQRREPAGRRLGLRAREARHPGRRAHLGRDDQQEDRRRCDAGSPGHPQGVRHVRGDAVRELARGPEHERTAAQEGPGAGLPQLLLLQVRDRVRRLLVLHDLHARHEQGREDHLQRPVSAALRRRPGATSGRSRSTGSRSTSAMRPPSTGSRR